MGAERLYVTALLGAMHAPSVSNPQLGCSLCIGTTTQSGPGNCANSPGAVTPGSAEATP